jgi:superfamily II DNA or RNA helicase
MLDRTERQKLGIKRWKEAGCRATLQWATGVGKTNAALIAIKSVLAKNPHIVIVVIVPTEHLQTQWLTVLARRQLITNVQVEIINSAVKRDSSIDFVILDECHRYASNLFYSIFSQRKPQIVLGLSATFNRLDGRHELLKTYCPVCDVISIQEAITNNWLSPYREYKVLIEPDDFDVYRQASEEFFNAFAYFNHDFNLAMQCVAGVKKGYKVIKAAHYVRYEYAKALCTVPETHASYKSTVTAIFKELTAVAYTWMRALQTRKAFVMNHPKKIEIAKKILKARPESKAITFSTTIKQAEKFGFGHIIHSKQTAKKNRISLEEFIKLPYGVVHTAKSLDEGIDIPGLNLAVILCNTSSSTQKTQRVGRVIRYEQGKSAEIFTLVLKGTNEESWYNTSSSGNNYIEITEAELDDVLTKQTTNLTERVAVADELLFRI